MKCPIDGSTLETHAFHSESVDECPQCKGIWFSPEELREAKDEVDPNLNWLDFDLWSDDASYQVEWSNRDCPQCNKKMATITYGETAIQVEYCLDRHGIWLDSGEFASIIDALEQELISKDSSDYLQATLSEAKEIVVGEEGFVSDWKDFLTVSRLLQFRLLAENPKLAELLVALQSSTPFK